MLVKNSIFIFLIITLLSCGDQATYFVQRDMESYSDEKKELKTHFDNFKLYYRCLVDSKFDYPDNFGYTIERLNGDEEYGETDDYILGVCETVEIVDGDEIISSFSSVKIDKQFYYNSIYQERELLIFHELGHCIMDQGHRPDSIMSEHQMGVDTFLRDYWKFIEEFFSITGEYDLNTCKI